MSWLRFDFIPLVLLLIPLFLALVSARRSLPRAYRYIRGEQVTASLSDVFVVLGLIAAYISAHLFVVGHELDDGLQRVSSAIAQAVPKKVVDLSVKPSAAQIMTRISDDIEETSPFGDAATSQSVVRTLFVPGSLPGPGRDQDQVIGSTFSARAHRVTYILGCPGTELAGTSNANAAWRTQMMRFAFALLTDGRWREVQWGRSRASIYFMPGSRSFDSWTVDGSKGRATGIVAHTGSWGGMNTRPTMSALITSKDDAFYEMMKAEETLLQDIATQFLNAELAKEPYQRDPIMVFYDASTHMGLAPKTLEEIRRISREWAARWDVDTGSRRPKPRPLQELEDLIVEMAQKSQKK